MVNGTWEAATQDLLGCAIGHVGWFMRDVWTREMVGGPTILSDDRVHCMFLVVQLARG